VFPGMCSIIEGRRRQQMKYRLFERITAKGKREGKRESKRHKFMGYVLKYLFTQTQSLNSQPSLLYGNIEAVT
jgi:hypothetical protein